MYTAYQLCPIWENIWLSGYFYKEKNMDRTRNEIYKEMMMKADMS